MLFSENAVLIEDLLKCRVNKLIELCENDEKEVNDLIDVNKIDFKNFANEFMEKFPMDLINERELELTKYLTEFTKENEIFEFYMRYKAHLNKIKNHRPDCFLLNFLIFVGDSSDFSKFLNSYRFIKDLKNSLRSNDSLEESIQKIFFFYFTRKEKCEVQDYPNFIFHEIYEYLKNKSYITEENAEFLKKLPENFDLETQFERKFMKILLDELRKICIKKNNFNIFTSCYSDEIYDKIVYNSSINMLNWNISNDMDVQKLGLMTKCIEEMIPELNEDLTKIEHLIDKINHYFRKEFEENYCLDLLNKLNEEGNHFSDKNQFYKYIKNLTRYNISDQIKKNPNKKYENIFLLLKIFRNQNNFINEKFIELLNIIIHLIEGVLNDFIYEDEIKLISDKRIGNFQFKEIFKNDDYNRSCLEILMSILTNLSIIPNYKFY